MKPHAHPTEHPPLLRLHPLTIIAVSLAAWAVLLGAALGLWYLFG